jgi:transposase
MTNKHNDDLAGLATVGVDIGKDVFHLVGFDASGAVVLRRKIKRLALVPTFEALPRCVVGMEACLSAHFVSRTLRGENGGEKVFHGSGGIALLQAA